MVQFWLKIPSAIRGADSVIPTVGDVVFQDVNQTGEDVPAFNILVMVLPGLAPLKTICAEMGQKFQHFSVLLSSALAMGAEILPVGHVSAVGTDVRETEHLLRIVVACVAVIVPQSEGHINIRLVDQVKCCLYDSHCRNGQPGNDKINRLVVVGKDESLCDSFHTVNVRRVERFGENRAYYALRHSVTPGAKSDRNSAIIINKLSHSLLLLGIVRP